MTEDPDTNEAPLRSEFAQRVQRFAWIPIPVFLGVILLWWSLDLRAVVIEPPYLLPILNFTFRTAIGIFIAYLAARGFSRNGSLPLLGLGCGMLFFGTSSMIAALAVNYGHINLGLTVYNTGLWLAGGCHLFAAVASVVPGGWTVQKARLIVSAAYATVLLLVSLLAFVALERLTPIFFVQGDGPTIIRQLILGSAIALFSLAALLVAVKAWRQDWVFGKWYAMALALIATGILGIMLPNEVGGPLGWIGRFAQYLGALYMLGAVLFAAGKSGEWDALLQNALRHSEERFQTLAEATFEGIVVSEENVIVDTNDQLAHLLGCDQQELIGKPVASIFPEDDATRIREHLASGTDKAIEHHLIRKDGTPLTVETHARRLERPGRKICFLAIRDITERKRQDEALGKLTATNERNLAQLNAIVNQMTEGLVIFDPAGNLIDMNRAAQEIHGIEDLDYIRRNLDQLTTVFEVCDLDSNPLPTDRWPIGRALKGETFSAYEVRVRRVDTNKSWIGSYGGAPVYDEDGHMQRAIVTLRDVTAQRMAEEGLKKSREELEKRVVERTAELKQRADQLARLTSELTLTEQRERGRLAQVLHDHLQQLLVGARYSLTLLARKMPDGGETELDRVEQLLNESIEASRLLTVELSPPILHEGGLADGLRWLTRWARQKFGLIVHLEIDEGAETKREDVRILLFQAVRELLLNISKYAGVSEAFLELTQHDKEQLRITVEDRGSGFDPKQIAGTENISGGFGLFSIRERLDLLGGHFTIDAAPGKGARFTLIAPRSGGNVSPGAIETGNKVLFAENGDAPKKPVSLPRMAIGPLRILLVDDHAVMRQGLSLLLKVEEDLEIVGEAADGNAAVEMARQLDPDVILMDFSMPRLDGVKATQIIRRERPHIQVIGLSMYEEDDRASEMLKAGAGAYVTKSGKSEILLAAIRRVASREVPMAVPQKSP